MNGGSVGMKRETGEEERGSGCPRRAECLPAQCTHMPLQEVLRAGGGGVDGGGEREGGWGGGVFFD